jgi:cysteine-rich repeat protein
MSHVAPACVDDAVAAARPVPRTRRSGGTYLLIWMGMALMSTSGCAQILGIEDLPDLVDAGSETADAREGCGNGRQEFGEACDDGSETQRCNADCSLSECGDGKLNRTAGEECDDDNLQPGDGCDVGCRLECGNGRLDEGEACDTGENTATCDVDCTIPACGDGLHNSFYINPSTGLAEACDEGSDAATCDSDCTLSECGDGHRNIEASEACDTQITTLICDADCTAPVCGDGFVNAALNEVCDSGVNVSDCDEDCTRPLCGDGIVNSAAGEQCEDGNTTDGDGCSAANGNPAPPAPDPGCRLENCGDNMVNKFEQCDQGADNGNGSGGCSVDCRLETVCGNSAVNAPESCDKGSNDPTCDADCTLPTCSDGFLNPTFIVPASGNKTEQCDDGNTSNGDYCTDKCQLIAVCGNSIEEPGELCDAGGNSVNCDADCTDVLCGDGFLNPRNVVSGSRTEQCDDSNNLSGDGCDANCQHENCGDGVTDPFEQCDDVNVISGDGCSSACLLENCGNGTKEMLESCDDGNNVSGDGCSADCRSEVPLLSLRN